MMESANVRRSSVNRARLFPMRAALDHNVTMAHLDHFTVPCRDKTVSAKLLADLLGVPWSPAAAGPFCAVYINDGLTLDFDETTEPFPILHFCFRVSQEAFTTILGRIKSAGIPYRSSVHGPVDMEIDTQHGSRIVYWNEPDGHQWELLTVSYARQPG